MYELAFFFVALGIVCGLIAYFALKNTKKSKT
jgi:hypothetical protein